MKYLDEFRDPVLAKKLFEEIAEITTKNWAIMEVCGGQTHSIIRNGIDQLLPEKIELIHGPGCPVCVTPLELIDKALAIAAKPNVIFCSFGDMLRVPGSEKDLFRIKSEGGDVRTVYSPLDALKIAKENPDKEVVFFGVGFETTAPANAMTVFQAEKQNVRNFSMLVSHVLVPPAVAAIMESPTNRVNAFLAAGHVCSIMGYAEYPPLTEKYNVPIIVTGFEPLDVLEGIRRAVIQLEANEAKVENAYERIVTFEGNTAAQKMLADVFETKDRAWRGIGVIPKQRLDFKRNLPRFRCRIQIRRNRHRRARIEPLSQRRSPARNDQTARMPRVRQRMHAAQTARRNNGFKRRRVRSLLQLREICGDGEVVFIKTMEQTEFLSV